jgi:hypothetical protein
MITVEGARRIVDRFRLGFTDDYIIRRIHSGQLEKVSKPYNGVRDSSYGYGVSIVSLVKLLLDYGVTEKEIDEILPV